MLSNDVEKRFTFTKENIDEYLKAVAKEYRKIVGKKMPAELIFVGGASILCNYDFRDSTVDIDTLIEAASGIKDAINRVRDQYNLPIGWINDDFKFTDSYTPNLRKYSVYYRTFSNVLTVRMVAAEYLIAMKLRSGRSFKHDLSDVVGILMEHNKRGEPITIEQIKNAVSNLYGEWEKLPEKSREFVEEILVDKRYVDLYEETKNKEKSVKDLLVDFQIDYPDTLKESNIDSIINSLMRKL